MDKLEVKDLNLIFGPRKKEALSLLKKGRSKAEVLKKTKCTVAVKDANFSIKEGEIFVVMGLSGSGKSSLIRCFNKLNHPVSGEIFLNGKDVLKMNDKELLQLRRKEMSMVFQHFGLLPHRTVLSNTGFGLEIQGVAEEKRNEIALEMIKVVGLQGYENMMTSELSGGMQQRVGLARALTTGPEILLMDEAFSALDPLIRSNMQDELIELQKKLKKTIVFITHDLDEALKLGDRIAIMKDGAIVQIGTPEDILVEPADDYVTAFVENVDRSNIVTASSIMFDKPTKLEIEGEGPAVALRRMRESGLNALPVIDGDGIFKGFVTDDKMAELKKKGIKDVANDIETNVSIVSPDTYLSEILPLFIENIFPVAVVDDKGKFYGIVIHSSVLSSVIRREESDIIDIKEGGAYDEN